MSSSRNSSSARERARQIAQQQQRKEKARGAAIRWGIVAFALAICVALGYVVWQSAKPADPAAGPANFNASGGIVLTGADTVQSAPAATLKPDEKPTALATAGTDKPNITIYVDYMCPACGSFEKQYSPELKQILADGLATVEYHPISILDQASKGSKYSTRAANAAACVAEKEPSKFLAYSEALFENQPEEGTTGLDDAKLVELAKESAGVDIQQCVADGPHKPWVKLATSHAQSAGLTGTPTVMINDQAWDRQGTLTGAVEKAKK